MAGALVSGLLRDETADATDGLGVELDVADDDDAVKELELTETIEPSMRLTRAWLRLLVKSANPRRI